MSSTTSRPRTSPVTAAGCLPGQVHHVPAGAAGSGRPGRLQPCPRRPWLADVRHPHILAHLALCVGLTYASNRALAALFRVRPHSESSLITGLLLYFLFWPTCSVRLRRRGLAGVALACVLASASKYALAWRGRHIFNPAAAGAFITGPDRAEYCHLVGGDPGDAVAAGSRRPAGSLPDPENADGRGLPVVATSDCERRGSCRRGDPGGACGSPWRSARC